MRTSRHRRRVWRRERFWLLKVPSTVTASSRFLRDELISFGRGCVYGYRRAVLRRSDGNRFHCDRRRDDIAANDLSSSSARIAGQLAATEALGGSARAALKITRELLLQQQSQRSRHAPH